MEDHRESIQTDESIPPWERPGCFRRDCEPHRGDMLWWLGFASLFLGTLALLPYCGWVPGLVGIPFGLCGRYLTKADLAEIRAGRMDPAGEGITAWAANLINHGLWFSIAGTVVWGGLILFLQWFTLW